MTNRFAPLNEGGLFTSCIGIVRIGEGRRKAGNDSEMKQHSCGPDDRPMCVWVEIAIGSAGESRPPLSLSQLCRKGAYTGVWRYREKERKKLRTLPEVHCSLCS